MVIFVAIGIKLSAFDMKNITPAELYLWLKEQRDFMLIDIREDEEHKAFNIGGIHLPMADLLHQKNNIPRDKNVVLYCEKGIRSVIAIQRLESSGFNNLYNLSGGVTAWKLMWQPD